MIPLADPKFDGNEIDYVTDALKSGKVARGPYVDRFEKELTDLFGRPAVTCSSGTAALHLALLALGIGPGDEVIVPDLTFGATVNVVVQTGARPVLVDVLATGLIDPVEVERNITDRTRAIIAVHLYGQMADMDALMARGISVIEDAAEIVAPYEPRGRFACLSFYPNKWITTGEGGAVIGAGPLVGHFASHGMNRPYFHDRPGLNYRMTNVQAAIGCAQLAAFRERNQYWSYNAHQMQVHIPGSFGDWLCVAPKRSMTVCETRPVFNPLHTFPYLKAAREFPEADRLHRDYMCLPNGPHLSLKDMHAIIGDYHGRGSNVTSIHRVRSETGDLVQRAAIQHRSSFF